MLFFFLVSDRSEEGKRGEGGGEELGFGGRGYIPD